MLFDDMICNLASHDAEKSDPYTETTKLDLREHNLMCMASCSGRQQ